MTPPVGGWSRQQLRRLLLEPSAAQPALYLKLSRPADVNSRNIEVHYTPPPKARVREPSPHFFQLMFSTVTAERRQQRGQHHAYTQADSAHNNWTLLHHGVK